MAKTTVMAMMRSTRGLVGLGVGLSLGCLTVRPNPDHCANLEGDRTCADRYPGERVYCTACGATPEDGCVVERPEDDTCYSPCGGRTPFEEDATCLVGSSSSSGEESTSTGEETGTGTESSNSSSESSTTTGPMPCVTDEECTEPEAPFCGTTGECGTCDQTEDGDAACAELDPLLPLCVADACVACTDVNPVVCEGQLLLCDGSTNSCVPCSEHGQCPSGACELSVGRCFPDDFVVRVDGDEVAMPPMLYETITDAVAAVPAGMHGVIIVHELDGAAPYTESVTLDADKTVALLAAPGEAPIIQGTGGNPGLRVQEAGTILYMDGLRVAGNTMGLGLRVNDTFAWVDRSRIIQNSGGGIVAENGAELVLRNCFVGGGTEAIGVVVADASATVLYSTVTANTFMSTPALSCTTPLAVNIRNSIIVSQGGTPPDELSCTTASVTTTATESDAGAFNLGWFVNYNAGDFSLSAMGAMTFADVAQWSTGDPPTDIDGDPRPAVDGTPDYAGADVPQ